MTLRIQVTNLNFTYPGGWSGPIRLKDLFGQCPSRMPPRRILQDVSFALSSRHCLGVVGKNGAGKSTLLKLLVGALQADSGSVMTQGRIAPIIGLGSGLHPEYNADENALLMAVAMGHSLREAKRLLDDIINFAGLQEHRQKPLRFYSSGMLARLAFSIATSARPDILLIDEALSVGDFDFTANARERMRQLMDGPVATVLVTHDMHSVRNLCHEAIWIESGRVACAGEPDRVIEAYLNHQQGESRIA